ncbi:MAG: MBL fold metallo-hydrolase [Bacilli bacterium]|jgi:7,8-dihydropterin-6-yl-methyl-4-(beta-D-ribofuranosyl)aminobenzene 5'-phosphate synthase|nr:MBL fold metallo-hydrolase [Bacilli bacterium]
MKIRILVDDRLTDSALKKEHGMSILLETTKHHILFDMGKTNLFIQNARIKKWDIKQVDIAVLSHGHHDHGGGLTDFLMENDQAPVWIQKKAFNRFYSRHQDGLHYIGLSSCLLEDKRINLLDGNVKIDDTIQLFQIKKNNLFWPALNKTLFQEKNERLEEDCFDHEQYLLIQEENKQYLISGCSHCGIIGIVEEAKRISGKYPDVIIGGFHLYSDSLQLSENSTQITEVANYLKKTGAMIYTLHCTGEQPFIKLKKILPDRIELLSTGEER